MIPIDKLKAVRIIVTHANCPDGIASAMILKDALPDAVVRFIQYGKEQESLPAEFGMLFCDMTPPASRVQEFVDAGAIVLDHHVGAKDIVAAFGELGVFADERAEPGVSGAVLAYRVAFSRLISPYGSVEYFATLAGVRDTWQTSHRDWARACAQATVLLALPWSYWERIHPSFRVLTFTQRWLESYGPIGEALLARQAGAVAISVREAYRFTSNAGTRVAVLFNVTATSDAAELLGDAVDLVVGFNLAVEDGRPLIRLSIRSHSKFDCLAFARYLGGGGHTKAAGATVMISGDGPRGPYDIIRFALDRYETDSHRPASM